MQKSLAIAKPLQAIHRHLGQLKITQWPWTSWLIPGHCMVINKPASLGLKYWGCFLLLCCSRDLIDCNFLMEFLEIGGIYCWFFFSLFILFGRRTFKCGWILYRCFNVVVVWIFFIHLLYFSLFFSSCFFSFLFLRKATDYTFLCNFEAIIMCFYI